LSFRSRLASLTFAFQAPARSIRPFVDVSLRPATSSSSLTADITTPVAASSPSFESSQFELRRLQLRFGEAQASLQRERDLRVASESSYEDEIAVLRRQLRELHEDSAGSGGR